MAPKAKGRPKRGASAGAGDEEGLESPMLPAFNRAIAAATQNVKMNPEDMHQLWALRKGKLALLESLRNGNDLGIGALHTLKGVGHWVVQQVKDHLDGSSANAAKRPRQHPAPPASPHSFTWWYLDAKGEYTQYLNSAEQMSESGSANYRVCIRHATGRVEKAWLPSSKAPPLSQGAPEENQRDLGIKRAVRANLGDHGALSNQPASAANGSQARAPPANLTRLAEALAVANPEEIRRKRLARFGGASSVALSQSAVSETDVTAVGGADEEFEKVPCEGAAQQRIMIAKAIARSLQDCSAASPPASANKPASASATGNVAAFKRLSASSSIVSSGHTSIDLDD